VRTLCLAVGLTAVLVLSGMSSGNAASSGTKTSSSSSSSSSSKASTSDVPPNCIRQACGKLWCWQMGGSKSSSR
jgi:hypothetical protein